MNQLKLIITSLVTVTILTTSLQASEDNPTAFEVGKLYVATFNRAPDSAGLDYWVNSGLKLSEIAQSFFDQPETAEAYPSGTSNRVFVQNVYQNLFNREPDIAGWDYWEAELNAERFSKNRFIEAVIGGALSDDAVILENKNEVGLHFANAGMSDTDDARLVMQNVTEDSENVAFIKEQITNDSLESSVWDELDSFVYNDPAENLSSSFIAGKIIEVDPESETFMSFFPNGNFMETGVSYENEAEPYPYACTGTWTLISPTKVAATCFEKHELDSQEVFLKVVIDFKTENISSGLSVDLYDYNLGAEKESFNLDSVTDITTSSFIAGKVVQINEGDTLTMMFSPNGNYLERVNDSGCTGTWSEVGINQISFECGNTPNVVIDFKTDNIEAGLSIDLYEGDLGAEKETLSLHYVSQ